MNLSRLRQLERKAEKMVRNKRQLACVTFADGTVQRMPAPDVIPLFCSPIVGQIVEVTGGDSVDEKLVELLAALVGEVPEVSL